MNQFRILKLIAAVSLMISVTLSAGTQTEASLIKKIYENDLNLWNAELRLAKDDVSREQVLERKPNPQEPSNKLKKILTRDLQHEWTLEYTAWVINHDDALKASAQRALLKAVETHHIRSSALGPFCIAMTKLNDRGEAKVVGKSLRSRGIELLERVIKENPHTEVQGQAHLALSMMLASIGDDKLILTQRIKHIREAIVKSDKVKVGDVTVSDLAKDELYQINYLTTGRTAPELAGTDASGLSVKLSDYRGKVVMIVFWSGKSPYAEQTVKILNDTKRKRENKPFVILGVNSDSYSSLRRMEASGNITWKNISDSRQTLAKQYFIRTQPYCMVVDQQGIIRYRGIVGSFATAIADGLFNVSSK